MEEQEDSIPYQKGSSSVFLVVPEQILFQPWIFLEIARFLSLHDILSLGSCNRAAQEALHSEGWQAPFWKPLVRVKCCADELASISLRRRRRTASRFLRYYFRTCANWQAGHAVLKTLADARRSNCGTVDHCPDYSSTQSTSRQSGTFNSGQRRTPRRSSLGDFVVSNSLAVFLHTGVSTFCERGRASSLIVIDLSWDPVDFSVTLWCNEEEQNRRCEPLSSPSAQCSRDVRLDFRLKDRPKGENYDDDDVDDIQRSREGCCGSAETQELLVPVVAARYWCHAVKSVNTNVLFFLSRNSLSNEDPYRVAATSSGGSRDVSSGTNTLQRRTRIHSSNVEQNSTVTPPRTSRASGSTGGSHGRRSIISRDEEDLEVVSLRYANANAIRPLSSTPFKKAVLPTSGANSSPMECSNYSGRFDVFGKGRQDNEDWKPTPSGVKSRTSNSQVRPATAIDTNQMLNQTVRVTYNVKEAGSDVSDDGMKENRTPHGNFRFQIRRNKTINDRNRRLSSCNSPTSPTMCCRRVGNVCFSHGMLASICVEGSNTFLSCLEKWPASAYQAQHLGGQQPPLNFYLDLLVVDPTIIGIRAYAGNANRTGINNIGVVTQAVRSTFQGASNFAATGRIRLVPSVTGACDSNLVSSMRQQPTTIMNELMECFGTSVLALVLNEIMGGGVQRTQLFLSEEEEEAEGEASLASKTTQSSRQGLRLDHNPSPSRLLHLEQSSSEEEADEERFRTEGTPAVEESLGSRSGSGIEVAVVGVSTSRIAYGRGKIDGSSFRRIPRLCRKSGQEEPKGTLMHGGSEIPVVLSNFKLPKTRYSTCMSASGDLVVLGGGDGALSLVEVMPSGSLSLKERNRGAHRAAITGVSFRSSGRCLSALSHVEPTDDSKWLPAVRAVSQYFRDFKATSQHRSECASCSLDTCVKLWDARASLQDSIGPSALHQDAILCVCFGGSDDTVILSGSTTGIVTAWDTRSMLVPLFAKDFSDAGSVVALQADSRSCLVECRTAAWDRRFFLMDFSADTAVASASASRNDNL